MTRSICGRRGEVRGVWALLAACVLAVISWAPAASAQQQTFYLDRLQTSGAPDDGLAIWRPYVHEKTRFYYSATLGYTANPLRANAVTTNQNVADSIDNPVRHQVITYMSAGIEAVNRVTVGLSLPVALYQGGGADPQAEGVGSGLERTAVAAHDLRLDGRFRIYTSSDDSFSFGAGVAVWFPTGNDFAFAGDGQTSSWLFGTGEWRLPGFIWAGHIGPQFRPDRSIGGPEGTLEISSEIRWGTGLFLPLRDDEVRLGASLWGTTGLGTSESGESTFFSGPNTDIEWLAEIRNFLDDEKTFYVSGGGGTRLAAGYGAPDVRLLVNIGAFSFFGDVEPGQRTAPRKAPRVEMSDRDTDGDGYPDDIDMCPTIKEDEQQPDPSDGCPAPSDRDKDGIPDDEDKCPDEPEDRDHVEDHDGCPETDADNDGILDVDDACPTVAGGKHVNPKKNGCPKKSKPKKKIVETSGGIELLEAIQFETAKSTIKRVSYPILDEVVEVLEARPNIRMAVHGHTDGRGARPMNMNLSKARAKAVLDYLVSKGIARRRLESDGFGPDEPIASNDTEEGRAKNRRVEFKVLDD